MQASSFNWKSLVFLSIPFCIYLMLLFGEQFASSMPWYRPWQPVVLIVGVVLIASAVSKRMRLRKGGFEPSRPGFSGEVDLLAKKLQDRLQEIDRAIRFQRIVPPMPREFGEFAQEVIQTALVVDKTPILPQWKSLKQEDEEIQFQLKLDPKSLEHGLQEKFERYQLRMTNAIEELRIYSESVKEKGGLYRLSKKEGAISMILIFGFSVTGAFLIWKHWPDREWPFWMGVGAIALAGIIMALLVGVLKDQESTK